MLSLPSLLVGRALWEEFLTYNEPVDEISFPDRSSSNRNFWSIQDLMQLQLRIHFLRQNAGDQKTAEEAWLYDDRALEYTSKKIVYQRWNSEDDDVANSWVYTEATGETRRSAAEEIRNANNKHDASKMPFSKGDSYCISSSVSLIDRTSKFYTWKIAFKPSRFRFLEVEGKDLPSKETWISERTSDGRFVLAEPVEGRDNDVLSFLNEYSKNPELGNMTLLEMHRRLAPEIE